MSTSRIASRFVRISRALASHFGLSDPAEAAGKSDFDMFTGDDAEQAFADEREVIRTGSAAGSKGGKETWPDSHQTWASTTQAPFCNRVGEIIGTVGISRDISERRRAQHQFQEYKTRLQELVGARTSKLTRAIDALASCNADLEKFAHVGIQGGVTSCLSVLGSFR